MSTALLLIDFQQDYFPGGRMELVGSIEAAGATARLLDAFRKSSWPVYHVQHVSIRPTATFFQTDTPGLEIHSSVVPQANEPVITKHFPNSFRETNLLDKLKTDGITQLLVCGMMTSMCIDATVRAAFDLGFECTIAQDACASKDLTFDTLTVPAHQVQAAFLAALASVYATIRTTDAILDGLISK